MVFESQAGFKLAGIPGTDKSFPSDLFTSQKDAPDKPITCGFYRQEAGKTLEYTYDYHEMKIILESEFHIEDGSGKSVVAKPGDVIHFHPGDAIKFTSPSYGLAFFCGQKAHGHL